MASDARSLRLLFLSLPAFRLGDGSSGGVEFTIRHLAQVLQQRGHQVTVVAPEGSHLTGVPIHPIAGVLHPSVLDQDAEAAIQFPQNSLLAHMWAYARDCQEDYDLLVNFAYDWLPFYLTPFFEQPIAHFLTIGSASAAVDHQIAEIAAQFPNRIGAYTQAQAQTFSFAAACRPLGSAIDLTQYLFCDQPGEALAWLGRIAPEKGLEDAFATAQLTQTPLWVCGKMQDEAYWQQVCQEYPDAPVKYLGFLSTAELQAKLGQCQALLMTHRWTEAFGIVAIEALACGVPVIAYQRGGPAEIVRHGQTGWLVEPDSVTGLVDAIARIDYLDRQACRHQAEQEYSLEAWGDRFEAWFHDILS